MTNFPYFQMASLNIDESNSCNVGFYNISKIIWHIGYHIELDELFLYRFEFDETVKIMMKGIDAICFVEFMNHDGWIELGEL